MLVARAPFSRMSRAVETTIRWRVPAIGYALCHNAAWRGKPQRIGSPRPAERTVAATESTSRAGASREADARVVVLVDAPSSTERALLADWVQKTHPTAQMLDHGDATLAARLNGGSDPLLVPARVT